MNKLFCCYVIFLLALCCISCANKDDKVIVITDITDMSGTSLTEGDSPTKLTVSRKKKPVVQDTLSMDSLSLDSIALDSLNLGEPVVPQPLIYYRWGGEYTASSVVTNDVDNSEYEINILINLLDSATPEYMGGLVLYIDEENYVEAVVNGKAEENRITVYYEENMQNSTGDLFKDGDKLVTFELSNGEYVASWYKPMHRFVNSSTVISIR